MKQQTAVEWLEKELECFCIFSKLTFSQGQELRKRLRQAKEMERQQIILGVTKHLPIEYGVVTAVQKAERYYNEEYEK